MTELNNRLIAQIDETHDTVIELKTVLLGKNGDPGLVGKVDDVCDSHYTLKRNFYILIAFLVGSGIIGISVWDFLR